MEPESVVLAEFPAGLYLNDRPFLLAEMTAYEVVIIYFPEKADALTVLAVGIGHACLYGYLTYTGLGNGADREHKVAELVIADAGKEIRLVLHRVNSRRQPYLPVEFGCGGIMACGGLVEFMPPNAVRRIRTLSFCCT